MIVMPKLFYNMTETKSLDELVEALAKVVDSYNKARFDPYTIQVGDRMPQIIPIYRELKLLRDAQKYGYLEEEQEL